MIQDALEVNRILGILQETSDFESQASLGSKDGQWPS
jgi:hypothetical protein